ncbi:peptidase S8/S53 domain-containing protein [Lasiosphaeria miniovina]|uniref:Peptidase S8/S53 domain-containing protein n=1 Tax=Lasiosphaeria miniovina TaxID=1954250 RepID=A0AA40BF06_9PEZI|nr:peptidase S8/S53 domain-containing protein [Lasiosphaeria miniovina]KAK0733000.1 peptidase S8/S53 domain-containing protein [Lasiosphaeria miniovina]
MHLLALATLLPLALTAPVLQPRGVQLIPDSYIVKFKDGATDSRVTDTLSGLKSSVVTKHIYRSKLFKGFAAKLSAKDVEILKKLPEVDYIEQDGIVRITEYVTQSNVPWGLARISHRATGATSYVYDASAGAGTCSYVIDTGIYVNHTQFAGRATWLANFAGDGKDSDGNGHGTHVAGTIGGTDYGVAKKTLLYAVKVLDSGGSGSISGVIAGINYVTTDSATRNCPNGTVANMSLGGGKSTAINSAAAAAIKAGVFLAVAAGNSDDDAAFYSPASEPTVCTIGATDNTDTRAYFSNYGTLVDIFAPGVDVLSSWIGGTNATNTISGTSMATPHITGLGAYLLGLLGKKAPQALCQYLKDTATANVITDVPTGTINALAFNGVE